MGLCVVRIVLHLIVANCLVQYANTVKVKGVWLFMGIHFSAVPYWSRDQTVLLATQHT